MAASPFVDVAAAGPANRASMAAITNAARAPRTILALAAAGGFMSVVLSLEQSVPAAFGRPPPFGGGTPAGRGLGCPAYAPQKLGCSMLIKATIAAAALCLLVSGLTRPAFAEAQLPGGLDAVFYPTNSQLEVFYVDNQGNVRDVWKANSGHWEQPVT